MRLICHTVVTDVWELSQHVTPEIEWVEYWKWEHNGRDVLIFRDNFQIYARIDGGRDHDARTLQEVAWWVWDELSKHGK